MAEIKWIKIYIDIWNNRKIKQIETLPDGDAILVIWLKILTLAGSVNDGGMVYFTQDIPYTDQMLATEFGKPIATIQMALRVFEQFGMIEIINDIIYVSNWEKYQAIEGMEKVREQNRIRKQRQRDREKMLVEKCPVTVTVCHATDKEKEEDKEKRKKDYKRKTFSPPTLEEVITYFDVKKISGDPQKFYEYYSVADWHDSKGNPVKNWKQKALAVWDKKDEKPSFDVKMTGSDDDIEDVDIDSIRDSLFG